MRLSDKINIRKLASPILMWGIVLFGITIVYIAFGGFSKGAGVFTYAEFISSDSYARLLVLPAFIYWIYFFSGAIRIHAEAGRSVEDVTKIVTSGVYGIVRHPIYAGDIVLSWGVFSYFPNFAVLSCVIWLNSVLFFWMKIEERLLMDKFGKDYEEYKKKVPMFIPGSCK